LFYVIVFRLVLVLTVHTVNVMNIIRKSILVLGDFTLFGWSTAKASKHFWRRSGLFLKQCEFIGVSSTGIILVAALFLGGVLGYQLYTSFHYFGADALLGGSVGVSLFRELAPVMAAIMVTGRAGAAMAAEIASMRISEQVDALEVMAVNPIEYLVVPRILAGTIMMPILSILFASVASLSGAIVACGVLGLDSPTYWEQFAYIVDRIEIIHCLVKGTVFGLVLTWMGCFCGFRAHGGARAVGMATRTTVVAACLTILLSDYMLTTFLPYGFTKLKV
jgi:phospholipid/cholesterol/gamma-HCH transport system permease protein